MGLRKKKNPELPRMARIQKMSMPELASWGEQCLIYVCRSFDDWRFRDGSHEEVLKATEIFHEILNEINIRVSPGS